MLLVQLSQSFYIGSNKFLCRQSLREPHYMISQECITPCTTFCKTSVRTNIDVWVAIDSTNKRRLKKTKKKEWNWKKNKTMVFSTVILGTINLNLHTFLYKGNNCNYFPSKRERERERKREKSQTIKINSVKYGQRNLIKFALACNIIMFHLMMM